MPPDRDRGNLAALDVLRGGAALYVAAYHSVGALTPSGLRFNTEGGSARLLLDGNPLGVFGFGMYAVLAFFVLSGFVVHLRQAQRAEAVPAARHVTADYAWRRAARLYPPLVGALVLAAVLSGLGNRLFPAWPWPPGTWPDARNVLVPVHGAATFANATTLWSIGFEIWFYVAYAALVLVVLGPRRGQMRRHVGRVLAGSLVVAAFLVLVEGQAPDLVPAEARGLATVAIYLPAWLGGAFLAELHRGGVALPRPVGAAAGAIALVLVAAPHSGNELRPAVDGLWCLAIGLLVAALTLPRRNPRPPGRPARWIARTAPWSYSLYLAHLPVIYFAQAAAGYDGAQRITSPLTVMGIFLLAVTSGWLFSLLVERPSRWLVSRPPWRRRHAATTNADGRG